MPIRIIDTKIGKSGIREFSFELPEGLSEAIAESLERGKHDARIEIHKDKVEIAG
jgi:hypothetical protein